MITRLRSDSKVHVKVFIRSKSRLERKFSFFLIQIIVRLLAKNLKKDHLWWENHRWWERDYEGELLSLKRKNAVKV